ncbi:hypothetical protein [Flavivirga sp. 57AJ16]|uniref:hypothetical protein n=1 Tax=Flavivirga sp. 57AJ16 TaxID=3025307 RepID=UPI0023672A07|nr:hypothetical protein [Flavivirga sp. 57AJ16]MDD7885619.1 hypothetical protein [Flavivirga sp. 57AJ16]
MRKHLWVLSLMVFIGCIKNKKANDDDSIVRNDSVFYSTNDEGAKTKTIYYPSKKEDSFRLRSYYENDKFIDSGYFSKNGFIKGNLISINNDGIKIVYEYINIDGSSTVNQFWSIKENDTLQLYGNYYAVKVFDSIKKQKHFQVQIALVKANDDNFSNLFKTKKRV